MSYYEYNPDNKFGFKDTLPEGHEEKIIKGSEFDDEFKKISAESQLVSEETDGLSDRLDDEIEARVEGDQNLQNQIDSLIDGSINIGPDQVEGLPEYLDENYVNKVKAEDQQIVSKFTFQGEKPTEDGSGNKFVVDPTSRTARFHSGQDMIGSDGSNPWDVQIDGSLVAYANFFPPSSMSYTPSGMSAAAEVYVTFRSADNPDNPINPDPQPAKWIVKPNLDVEGKLWVDGTDISQELLDIEAGLGAVSGQIVFGGTYDPSTGLVVKANLSGFEDGQPLPAYDTVQNKFLICTADGTNPFDLGEGDWLVAGESGWVPINYVSAPGLWTQNGSDIYYDAGNVGIGTDTVADYNQLHVQTDGIAGALVEATNAGGYAQLSVKTPEGEWVTGMRPESSGNFIIRNAAVGNHVTVTPQGLVGIGMTPATRTAKEQLAEWKASFDARLKAEPKADRKAITLEITDDAFEVLPTEEALAEWMETRGAGDLLQVAGNISATGNIIGDGELLMGTKSTFVQSPDEAGNGGFYHGVDQGTADGWFYNSGPASLLTLAGNNTNNNSQLVFPQNAGQDPHFRRKRSGATGDWQRFQVRNANDRQSFGEGASSQTGDTGPQSTMHLKQPSNNSAGGFKLTRAGGASQSFTQLVNGSNEFVINYAAGRLETDTQTEVFKITKDGGIEAQGTTTLNGKTIVDINENGGTALEVKNRNATSSHGIKITHGGGGNGTFPLLAETTAGTETFKLDGAGNGTFKGNGTFGGTVSANSIVKSGGTSAQLLCADGSVVAKDSVGSAPNLSNYYTKTEANNAFKPKSYKAPVDSVNGKTGAVTLNASDVGAKPSSYKAPVDSVNGKTGAVTLTASDVGASTYTGSDAVKLTGDQHIAGKKEFDTTSGSGIHFRAGTTGNRAGLFSMYTGYGGEGDSFAVFKDANGDPSDIGKSYSYGIRDTHATGWFNSRTSGGFNACLGSEKIGLFVFQDRQHGLQFEARDGIQQTFIYPYRRGLKDTSKLVWLGDTSHRYGAVYGNSTNMFTVEAESLKLRDSFVLTIDDVMDAFSTLRTAVSDEDSVEGLRTAISDSIGGLLQKLQSKKAELAAEFEEKVAREAPADPEDAEEETIQ